MCVTVLGVASCSAARREAHDPTVPAAPSRPGVTATPAARSAVGRPAETVAADVSPRDRAVRGPLSIARALERARDRLYRSADPDAVDGVFAPGTDLNRLARRDIRILARFGAHRVEVGQRLRFALVSAAPTRFTVRVTEHLAADRVVSASGAVLAERRYGSAPMSTTIVYVRSPADGRWRIAFTQSADPVVVEL